MANSGLKSVIAQLAAKARRPRRAKPKHKKTGKAHHSMDTTGDNIVKGVATAQGTLILVGDPLAKAVQAGDVKTAISGLASDVKNIPSGTYFKAMAPRVEAHASIGVRRVVTRGLNKLSRVFGV